MQPIYEFLEVLVITFAGITSLLFLLTYLERPGRSLVHTRDEPRSIESAERTSVSAGGD